MNSRTTQITMATGRVRRQARAPLPEEETMDTAPAGGDSAAPGPDRQPLTDRELELLAFERHWWRYAGAKEQAIKETFGFSTTRYYQLLGELIDRPEAL